MPNTYMPSMCIKTYTDIDAEQMPINLYRRWYHTGISCALIAWVIKKQAKHDSTSYNIFRSVCQSLGTSSIDSI